MLEVRKMRLIDADALLKHSIPLPVKVYETHEIIQCGIIPERCVHESPTIDAVPVVHARWIGGKYYNDVYGYEKTCTACKKEYVVGFDYLYCPYCGAKMDGEAEDDN
jgi:hypothetical protein